MKVDRRLVWFVFALVAGSCSAASEVTPASSTASTTSAALRTTSPQPVTTAAETVPQVEIPTMEDMASIRLSMPGAVAANIATNGLGNTVVAWIAGDEVLVAKLDLTSGKLSAPTDVSGDTQPVRHPIERPALAVRPDGVVDIAFTSLADGGGSVYHAAWDGESVLGPALVSGPPLPETNLVHMTPAAEGLPVLSWLEDSTLSVAVPRAGTLTEVERIDELTCDCCNQAPLLIGDSLVVAYRDLELIDGLAVRDVVITSSTADGAGFGPPVPIADDHWQISGCPFSGPAAVTVGDELVVAWMDARQSAHPNQDSSTIWIDRSSDAGATFGEDLALTSGGFHRWPVMAVDDERKLHVAWVTQGVTGGVTYAMSTDGGRSFGENRTLIGYSAEAGSPSAPSVVAADGLLVLTWADNRGGNVAAWPLETLAGR